jgi:hypothetical protein
MEPTNPKIKSEAARQFQHSYKKDMVRRSNEAIGGNQVWKWRLGVAYRVLSVCPESLA